jgi:DNA-directed RNA polymerase specialized sigma subunit
MSAHRLRQEIITDSYEDYRPILHSLVNQFSFRYRLNPHDLLSPAHEAFMQACNSFDSDSGTKLSSWIHQKVDWALRSFMRRELRHHHLETLENVPEESVEPDRFMYELKQELSKDARRIVRLVTTSSTEFSLLCKVNKTRCRLRAVHTLKEHLEDKGWQEDRINKRIEEVETVLNEGAGEDMGPRYIPIKGLWAAREDVWLLSRVGLTPKQVRRLLR